MALGDQTVSREYSIGRGQIYFKKYGDSAYKMLGNSPELTFSQAIEDLKHFSSRGGIKKQDAYVVLQQTLSGAFSLEELNELNLQYFFMSTTSASATQAPATHNVYITGAVQGGVYDLGYFNISSVGVSKLGGSPDYVLDTDYELDTVAGILYITEASAISATDIEIILTAASTTYTTVNAATATTTKGDFMFVGDPPYGARLRIKGYCSLKPGGDVGVISDDWMKMPFAIEFETNANYTGLVDVVNFGFVS